MRRLWDHLKATVTQAAGHVGIRGEYSDKARIAASRYLYWVHGPLLKTDSGNYNRELDQNTIELRQTKELGRPPD
jgi:hypothetical protein